MLIKPTEEQRRAMLLVRQNPATAPLLEFLKQENAAAVGNLMRIDDETTLRRLQGKASFIHDLLTKIGEVE